MNTPLIIATSAVLGTIAAMFAPLAARGHEAPKGWTYPWECCSNQDCKPTSAVEVRETRGGYLVVATGEIVPLTDKRVKDSPDGDYHICQEGGDFDHGKVLCLFHPPQSF